jgi:hypothetical protein
LAVTRSRRATASKWNRSGRQRALPAVLPLTELAGGEGAAELCRRDAGDRAR